MKTEVRTSKTQVNAIQEHVANRPVFQADKGEIGPIVGEALVRLAKRTAMDARMPSAWLQRFRPNRYKGLVVEAQAAERVMTALGHLAGGIVTLDTQIKKVAVRNSAEYYRVAAVPQATITAELPDHVTGNTVSVVARSQGMSGGGFSRGVTPSATQVSPDVMEVMLGTADFAARAARLKDGSIGLGMMGLADIPESVAAGVFNPANEAARSLSIIPVPLIEANRVPVPV